MSVLFLCLLTNFLYNLCCLFYLFYTKYVFFITYNWTFDIYKVNSSNHSMRVYVVCFVVNFSSISIVIFAIHFLPRPCRPHHCLVSGHRRACWDRKNNVVNTSVLNMTISHHLDRMTYLVPQSADLFVCVSAIIAIWDCITLQVSKKTHS